jgi:hypothetical protein
VNQQVWRQGAVEAQSSCVARALIAGRAVCRDGCRSGAEAVQLTKQGGMLGKLLDAW